MKSKKSKTENKSNKPTEWRSEFLQRKHTTFRLPSVYNFTEEMYQELDQALYDDSRSSIKGDQYYIVAKYFYIASSILEKRCLDLRKDIKDLKDKNEELKRALGKRKEFTTPEEEKNEYEVKFTLKLYNAGCALSDDQYELLVSYFGHKKNIILNHCNEVEKERDILKEKDNRLNKDLSYEIDKSKVEKKGTYQNYKVIEWMALNDH